MVVLALALALAQQPTGIVQQVYEMSGQVDRIDRAGRTINIISAGVMQTSIYAGPDVPAFDQLERGDIVVIRYYDAYIVEVTPDARAGQVQDTTADAQKKLNRPDADVTQQLSLVVTIDELDADKGMVTYHGADKRRVVRAVQHRQLIEHVKAGDVVTIKYTRARAVAIQKAQ